jgi:hypothetical protein
MSAPPLVALFFLVWPGVKASRQTIPPGPRYRPPPSPRPALPPAPAAPAQAVDEDATADLGPVLHVREHPCASQPVPSVVGQTASIVGRWR